MLTKHACRLNSVCLQNRGEGLRGVESRSANSFSPDVKHPDILYLYDHPAGDKDVGGGERRPEEGSQHEGKNNAENKILNRFQIKSFNGIKGLF